MPEVDTEPKAESPPKSEAPQLVQGVNIDDLAGKPPADLYPKLSALKQEEIAAKEKTYDTFTGNINKGMQQAEAAYEDVRKAGADVKNIKPWNADEEAKKYSHDPLEKLGSLGSVLGILASTFTHQPFENALNASAAAMGAIQNRDDLAFERAHATWKENIDLAMKRHNIEHTAYTDALSLMSHNMQAGRAMMEVQAARFGDQRIQLLLEAGMDKEVQDVINSRQRLATDVAKAVPGINEDWAKWKDLQDTVNEKLKGGMPRNKAMEEAVREVQLRWADPNRMRLGYGGGVMTPGRQEASEAEKRIKEYEAQGMPHDQAYAKAWAEIKDAKTRPTAAIRDKMAHRVDTISNMEGTIDKIEGLLAKHNAITGIGGAITRTAEAAGNIVFGSSETDRKQFERWVTEVKDWWRQIERVPGITLKGDAEDAAKIIAGLRPGDTVANTVRAYRELKPVLAKLKKQAEARRDVPVGESKPSSEPSVGKKPWESDPDAE